MVSTLHVQNFSDVDFYIFQGTNLSREDFTNGNFTKYQLYNLDFDVRK